MRDLEGTRPGNARGGLTEFHADDYGLFPAQSRRIFNCWEHGVLNAVSVMPNSPHLKDCMAFLPPNVRVAIHLNLMEGRSVRGDVPLLSDETGRFRVSFGGLLLASYLPGRARCRSQLKKEISAQIHAVLPYLNGPLRIDGHAHYHMIPVVFDALMDVIEEEGLAVEYIRIPREHVSLYLRRRRELSGVRPINLIKVLVLNCLAHRNLSKYKTFVQTLEQRVFLGVFLSGNMSYHNVSILLEDAKALAQARGAGLEILAHPGGVREGEDIAQLTHPDDISFLTSGLREEEAEMFLKLRSEKEHERLDS